MIALLLSMYGLVIFGDVAASLATVFIGQGAFAPDSGVATATLTKGPVHATMSDP